MTDVALDGESLTPEDVAAVAREDARVVVPDDARAAVRTARERVEDVLDGDEAVYGVTTGFGELVDVRVPPEDRDALQANLVRSHAAGAGAELPREAVRAMLATRINALAKGYSGVREVVIDHLVTMTNEGIHPVVKSRGSLGASGDLAPLAHLALVLLGEGQADVPVGAGTGSDGDDGETGSSRDDDGAGSSRDAAGDDPPGDDPAVERLPGDEALARVGLEPLTLRAKEGLALINGTQLSAGLAALLVVDAERLVRTADVAGALSTEVSMGSTVPAHPAIAEVRPHEGHAASARAVRLLTADSAVVESHRNCDRVQDPYSFRCLPQVHGAVREAIDHLREALETELNSVTDNPIVFPRDRVDDRASGTGDAGVLSGGNFHGEVLALRLDYLTSALTELAAIAERRVDHLLNPNLQEAHLPPFLAPESGLQSGYMLAQYTAAAMLDECRATGRPSTDNTPVSGNQEDHVSMSAQSALSARSVLENVETVAAIELLCGAQAAEFVDEDLELGAGTAAAHEAIREVVPPLVEDRPIHRDVEDATAAVAVAADAFLDRVEGAIGEELP